MSQKSSTAISKKLPVVLSLLDSPAYGGAEQYVISNLASLAKKGYPICLATNNDKVKEQALLVFSRQKISNVEIIRFPFVLDAIGNWKGLLKFFFWSPFALVWCYQLLSQLQQKHSKVICYWAGFSDRLLLSPVAKLKQCPLIWIEIGPLEPTFKKTWGFPKLLYQLTHALPNTFITTSDWTRQSMERHGIQKNDVTLVYPGVVIPTDNEVKLFREKGLSWRKRHHYHDKLLISFIGRMAQENEVDMLIRAFGIFHTKFHVDFRAVLIGDGPNKQDFETLAKELGIQKKVIFTGFVSQEEKLSMVAGSDLFVFSRAWDLDGFGMTTIEAMSVEVPVITSDFGPQQEIVVEHQNGLRFKPHDSQDLALKIRLLSTDKKLAKKVRVNGRKSMFPTFTETEMHRLTHKVIKTL